MSPLLTKVPPSGASSVSPTRTCVPTMKSSPTTETSVPPTAGPSAGENDVTSGVTPIASVAWARPTLPTVSTASTTTLSGSDVASGGGGTVNRNRHVACCALGSSGHVPESVLMSLDETDHLSSERYP